jgi:BirA family transcriptional regulator, biotin operon repressor / biotin---[acetyl-CoA-carboxylase] ligase
LVKIQPKTLFVGKNLIYLPTCHSTNDVAQDLIQNNDIIDGTVILAGHQTQGKGQRGNVWESQPNQNLLMSLVIKASFLKLQNQFFVSKIVAIAILKALKKIPIDQVCIKWPNDIYVNQKKLGGILIESSLLGKEIQYMVIGIGVNINQEHFSNPRATSLKVLLGQNQDTGQVASQICESIEEYLEDLKKENFEKIQHEYLHYLLGINQMRLFKNKKGIFEGIIRNVCPNGQLEIEENGHQKYYDTKEIEYLFDDFTI